MAHSEAERQQRTRMGAAGTSGIGRGREVVRREWSRIWIDDLC